MILLAFDCIVLWHPYFLNGGSEKTTLAWLSALRKISPTARIHLIVMRFDGARYDEITNQNVCLHVLKSKRLLYSIVPFFLSLRRLKYQRMLLIGVQPYAFFFLNIIKLFTSDIKTLASFRNHPNELKLERGLKNTILYSLLPKILRNFDFVTANSKETIAELLSYGLKQGIMYIRNHCDSQHQNIRLSKVSCETLQLCFIGRLCYQKNPLLVLEIAAKMNVISPVELHMYGEGELYDAVKQKAAECSYKVKMFGHIPTEKINFHTYDYLIFTSRYEGFPNVLLEAGINEVPIIAKLAKSGVKELLGEGRGIIFESIENINFAEAVRAARCEENRVMAENLKDYVKDQHSFKKLVEDLGFIDIV